MMFDTKNKLPEDHNVEYVMISDTVFQIIMENLIWLKFSKLCFTKVLFFELSDCLT